MQTIQEAPRDIPVVGEYDVIVAGGGPGGIPAAIAAARAGAKTLLIERYGFLGGMATAGLIGPILGTRASGSDEPIIGGIAEELCRAMADLGMAAPYDQAVTTGGIRFEPEGFKLVCDELVLDAGIALRLHSLVADALTEDGRIRALILESKSDREAVLGKVFVDATGDADVVARSGAAFTLGREADGRVESMGSMFVVGGVHEDELATGDQAEAFKEKAEQAVEEDRIRVYNRSLGSRIREAQRAVNATRFAGDCTNVDDLTRGEIQIRRDTWDFINFWREEAPGMGDCYVLQTPTNIGLRESRQMVGVDRVVGQDVVEARRRDDAVARCSYWIDIHCPMGRVKSNTHLCYKACPNDPPCPFYEEHYDELPDADLEGDNPRAALHPRDGLWFDIPYGALVSADLPNLLAAGRCISLDHQAMAAARVMGPCMAIGQAAGQAAAMAADADGDAQNVEVCELQERLRSNAAAV